MDSDTAFTVSRTSGFSVVANDEEGSGRHTYQQQDRAVRPGQAEGEDEGDGDCKGRPEPGEGTQFYPRSD